MSRRIVFEASAFEDFTEWVKLDKKLHKKIVTLIKDISRSPYTGLGKPEALKHDYQGYWSRSGLSARAIAKIIEIPSKIFLCSVTHEGN